METYRRCAYSAAELEYHLENSGAVGTWLWDRYIEQDLPEWVPLGAVWPLGDSPPLLITALSDESSTWIETQGPGQGLRRVYTEVEIRLLVGDMLAKLRLFAARG